MHRIGRILWTTERHTAIRLQQWYLTAIIYAGSMAVMGLLAEERIVSKRLAFIWVGGVALGLAGFHVMIRTEFSKRFKDPALTQAQIIFAIFAVMAGYTITGPARSADLFPLVIVLAFGAFSIGWQRMVLLTILALSAMGSTMVAMHLFFPGRYSFIIDLINFLVCSLALAGSAAIAIRLNGLKARLQQQRVELKAALARIQELATLDELTGLANRRRAQELLTSELIRVQRTVSPFSVALIDLDFFKQLNDRFGHSGGDEVLRRFSDEARGSVRRLDTVTRWGGEEFLILMPETDDRVAFEVLERLRRNVSAMLIESDAGQMRFTFSAGIATHIPGQTTSQTVARADRALYEAKSIGRNRVMIATQNSEAHSDS